MKYIYYLFLFTTLISCSDNKTESLNKILVTENIQSYTNLSNIAKIDKVETIKLNGFTMFDGIKRIRKYKDNLIIHSSNPNTISIINTDGGVLNQLKIEKGNPYAVRGLTEFNVYNEFIYLLDRENLRIYKLDENLDIITTYVIDLFCQSFGVLDDNKFILYVGNEISDKNKNEFIVYDGSTHKIQQGFSSIDINTSKYFKFLTSKHVLKNDNSAILWTSTKNLIYSYDLKNNFEPKYIIDYGKYSLPDNFYEESKFENVYYFVTKMRKTEYAYRHFDFKANSRYLKFRYEKGDSFINTLYNFETGRTVNFNKIKDDIITSLSFPGNFFFSDLLEDNKFIYYMPFEVLSDADNSEFGSILKKAKSRNENILVFGELIF